MACRVRSLAVSQRLELNRHRHHLGLHRHHRRLPPPTAHRSATPTPQTLPDTQTPQPIRAATRLVRQKLGHRAPLAPELEVFKLGPTAAGMRPDGGVEVEGLGHQHVDCPQRPVRPRPEVQPVGRLLRKHLQSSTHGLLELVVLLLLFLRVLPPRLAHRPPLDPDHFHPLPRLPGRCQALHRQLHPRPATALPQLSTGQRVASA
eukprot:199431-Rhodomonas_salina.1